MTGPEAPPPDVEAPTDVEAATEAPTGAPPDAEGAETPPDAPSGGGMAIDWRAVAWGAATGLVVLVLTTTLRAVLDRRLDDFDDSGWVYPLFVLVLVAYGVAGWSAARRARVDGAAGTPLTHGALAGLGALVAWLPLRALIWLVRDEDRGLVSGAHAALRPGQVFGHLVIAAGLGMLGGFLAGRRPDAE